MFSAAVLEHTAYPRNTGELANATHHGIAGVPGDGPYMHLWFEVEEGVIQRASYMTYGCPSAIASGSLCAEILQGRTVSQALLITPKDVQLLLGGLPEGKEYCAKLAIEALQDAFSE